MRNSYDAGVKINFHYIDFFDQRKKYRTTKSLTRNSSLQAAAREVVNEAIRAGRSTMQESVDESAPIAIHPACPGAPGLGVKYVINRNGTLRILQGFGSLYRDRSIAEIDELVNAGYIKGDMRTIVVSAPMGIGAAGMEPIFNWIGFLVDTFALSSMTVGGLNIFKIWIASRKARRIAKVWKNNGIKYPEDLREFIDTKAGWGLHEVKKRLCLDDEYATKLLGALGLEPVGNEWRLTHSKVSIQNRKRWMRNEKKYKKNFGAKK